MIIYILMSIILVEVSAGICAMFYLISRIFDTAEEKDSQDEMV